MGHIFGEGEVGGTLDGDVVVVVQIDQLAQAQVAGQGGRLGGDPLHEVAVADDRVHMMPDHLVLRTVERRRQEGLGDGHAHAVGEALPKRTGGDFDAGSVTTLGVPGRPAAPLAEVLDVVQGEIVARHVQQRVEQHGAVARAQDEAVAIGPVRVGRIVAQMPRPEDVGHGGRPQRHAGMTGLGLLHGLDGQDSDRVDRQLIEFRHAAHVLPFVVSHSSHAITGQPSAVAVLSSPGRGLTTTGRPTRRSRSMSVSWSAYAAHRAGSTPRSSTYRRANRAFSGPYRGRPSMRPV